MNIRFIKNNKFKSNSISLTIPVDLSEKITDLNLVSEMIKVGSVKYDSFKKLYSKLQDMYGAHFDCYVNKCGEVALFTIYIDFLKDKYIEGNSSLWIEVLDFLQEVFFNPLHDGEKFKEEFLKIEKESLRRNILGISDSKDYYAYVKCEELSTKGEPYENHLYGNIKRIDEVTSEGLYSYYKELREMPYYFLVMGDFDEEFVRDQIHKRFGENINRKFETSNNKFIKSDFKEEFERHNVTQTKLVIGFKSDITIFNGDYFAIFLFNRILGGGYSKLYCEVRQKRSLVYYINSYYEKFKGLLSIECGIEDKNIDLAKELIFKEIENMSKGDITDLEIENTKRSIERMIRSIYDRITSIHSFVVPLYIFGKDVSLDEFISNINSVSKERIIDVAKHLHKSAIFSVRPLEEVEN